MQGLDCSEFNLFSAPQTVGAIWRWNHANPLRPAAWEPSLARYEVPIPFLALLIGAASSLSAWAQLTCITSHWTSRKTASATVQAHKQHLVLLEHYNLTGVSVRVAGGAATGGGERGERGHFQRFGRVLQRELKQKPDALRSSSVRHRAKARSPPQPRRALPESFAATPHRPR